MQLIEHAIMGLMINCVLSRAYALYKLRVFIMLYTTQYDLDNPCLFPHG